MAQFVGRLTALKVLKVKRPGMYADGAGLYLQVTGDGDAHVANFIGVSRVKGSERRWRKFPVAISSRCRMRKG